MKDQIGCDADLAGRLSDIRAIALDRDGTINVDVGYPHRLADLEIIDGFVEFMRWAASRNLPVSVITNQSGVARGYYTVDDMHRFNAAINAVIAPEGLQIERFEFCPHLPDTGCTCRKPGTAMLERLSAQCGIPASQWIVFGDQPTDVECARKFGAVAVGVGSKFAGLDRVGMSPDFVVRTLGDFPERYLRAIDSIQEPV